MNSRQTLMWSFLIAALFASQHSVGDSLRDANELLEVAHAGRQFENLAEQQAHSIVATYSSILEMALEVSLPSDLQSEIVTCYSETYRWENFSTGITQLLAQELSSEQLTLLINFYNSQGLPPSDIELFKDTIAMADHIAQLSGEFIYNNSSGCVERDARLIHEFLRTHPGVVDIEQFEFAW